MDQLTELVRGAREGNANLLAEVDYEAGLMARWDARLQRAFFEEELSLVEIDLWLKNAMESGISEEVLAVYREEKNNRWREVLEAAKARPDLPPATFKELISKAQEACVPNEILAEYEGVKIYKNHMEAAFNKGLPAEELNPFLHRLIQAGLPEDEKPKYQERIFNGYEADLKQLTEGAMDGARIIAIHKKVSSAKAHEMRGEGLLPYLTVVINNLPERGNNEESNAAAECIQMGFYGGVPPEQLMPGVEKVMQMRKDHSLRGSKREMETSYYQSRSFIEKAEWVKSTLQELRAMDVPEDNLNPIKERFNAESIAYLEAIANEPYIPYKFRNTIHSAAKAGVPETTLAPYREQLKQKSGEYLPICFSNPKEYLPSYSTEAEALMKYFEFCKRIGVGSATLKPFGIPLLVKSIENKGGSQVEKAIALAREVGVSEEELAPHYPEVAEFYRKEMYSYQQLWEDDGSFPSYKEHWFRSMIAVMKEIRAMLGLKNAEPVRAELEVGCLRKLSVMIERKAKPEELARQIELARQVGVRPPRLQPFIMTLPSHLRNPAPKTQDQPNGGTIQDSLNPLEEREVMRTKLNGLQLQDFGIEARSKWRPYKLANIIEEARKIGIEEEALKPSLDRLKSLQESMLRSCMSSYHYTGWSESTDAEVNAKELSKTLDFAKKWGLVEAGTIERGTMILKIASLTSLASSEVKHWIQEVK